MERPILQCVHPDCSAKDCHQNDSQKNYFWFYLKEKQKEREKKRFDPLVHFPNGYSSWVVAWLRTGARGSIVVSQVDGRNSSNSVLITCCFMVTSVGNWSAISTPIGDAGTTSGNLTYSTTIPVPSVTGLLRSSIFLFSIIVLAFNVFFVIFIKAEYQRENFPNGHSSQG